MPLVSLQFEWDLVRYPVTTFVRRTSTKEGRSYRQIPVTIHMVQGPAKMEFYYSVEGERRGEAQSVDFHDLAVEPGDSPEEDDGSDVDEYKDC